MKITDVTVTPIAFADPPLLNAAGVHEPYALRTIIEVHTDDGISGLGETYGDAEHLALMHRATAQIGGMSPFDLNAMQLGVAATLGDASTPDLHGLTGAMSPQKNLARVFSPIEVACLDIQGKATGRPVHELLGGKVRNAVPFSAYLFYKWETHPDRAPDGWGAALDPDGVVAQARRMIDQYGFGSIKLKGGVLPPDEEMATIRALRDAFPSHPLRIDPNCAWTVPTSQRVARELDGLLEYLEDPTPGIPGMAAVAAEAAMPLATNMCVVAFNQVPESVRLDAVGVVLADHHYWGGLRACQRLAGICETFCIGLSMHSNSHLGISLAAMVHLAAATPHLSYACDTHIPWAVDDVITSPLSFVDGAVPVSDAPGLGVELDRDAVARLHEQYLRCGLRRRDDAGYMRRFDPGFTTRKATW